MANNKYVKHFHIAINYGPKRFLYSRLYVVSYSLAITSLVSRKITDLKIFDFASKTRILEQRMRQANKAVVKSHITQSFRAFRNIKTLHFRNDLLVYSNDITTRKRSLPLNGKLYKN